jgi:Surfeit locus protein 5 subunit 22 of Mediator complex
VSIPRHPVSASAIPASVFFLNSTPFVLSPRLSAYTESSIPPIPLTTLPYPQIRAAEDLLSLTRQMQELWLFGQLDTLGKSVVEEKTEADARRVAELIQTLVRREEVKEGGEAGRR